MSPYRGTKARNGPTVLRLAEPFPFALLAGVVVAFAAIVFGVLPLAPSKESVVWPCVFAAAGIGVVTLAVLARHRAWLVMMPNEERLRVVRHQAWSYSAATLRLSRATSVELMAVGNEIWLFVFEEDGRAARVLPTRSVRMLERVQRALEESLKSSDTRPETPSPR